MAVIRIGFLFSLSGTTSLTEIGQYKAARFALEEFQKINYDSEISFCFELRDICSDPGHSYQHALELAKSGVKIFIGCYTSACRKAILPVLEQYDCLLVYPTLYEGQEIHPNVFYIGEVPNQQVTSLLQFMLRQFGKRVYLVGNDYIYPRYTNQQIRELLQDLGGEVLGEQYVPLGHTQMLPILEDIKKMAPSVILSTLVGESVPTFYRSYYDLGLNPELLPILSPITTELEIQSMGAKYAAGHYSCSSYFQSLNLPENDRFVKNMQQEYGTDTVISSAMSSTYSGMNIILTAVLHLRSTDRKRIFSYLYKKTFSTPSGHITIESNHHLSREVRIGQSNLDGQFTIVWTSGQPIPAKPLMTNSIFDGIDTFWEFLVKEVVDELQKGIAILNENGDILYSNPAAFTMLRVKSGDTLRQEQLNEIALTFELTEKFNEQEKIRLLLITKRETQSNPSPSTNVRYQLGRIITYSPTFQKELQTAKIAAQSDASVLLLGETGAGKEVMARTIHEQSPRKNGPFIALNAGALPKELIGSELFGYSEGSFTGARKGGSIGKFEAANGGTLFLDEIGEMPLELQVSLLRVLEERKVVRIGDNKERPVNVRIIAATNRHLQEEIAFQGSFRSDLYYRLNVFTINIPPLRQRLEDIETLATHFLQQFYHYYKKGPNSINSKTLNMLKSHSWPGNIRELRNVLERAFLLAVDEDHILPNHLPVEFQKADTYVSPTSMNLRGMEKQMIEQTLDEVASVTEAAKKLGITRSTLYRKMKQWNIRKPSLK